MFYMHVHSAPAFEHTSDDSQATILLNANLVFLSVPITIFFPANDSSGDGGGANSYQHELVSPAAILSACSMLASIGSVIIGLLLVRQHRGEEIMDNPRTVCTDIHA